MIMVSIRHSLFIFGLLALAGWARAGELSVQSGPARAHLLELYTSEGCSSCPPAEQWFSTLKQNPRLWKEIVPVAFHVDYWDRLGWKDKLASPANTARQRNYAAAWDTDTVYTPGLVLDGQEWGGRAVGSIPASKSDAGTLTGTLRDNGEVLVTFSPAGRKMKSLEAHAALLGFGLKSGVTAGENRGRTLLHDFAVVAHAAGNMTERRDGFRVTLHLPVPVRETTTGEPFGLAVWVNEAGKLEPIQAAGGGVE
jgi:hypothetical protein